MTRPYPFDPVRFPESPRYAEHEQWCGRLRAFHTSDFYVMVFDKTAHDPGDEDRS